MVEVCGAAAYSVDGTQHFTLYKAVLLHTS